MRTLSNGIPGRLEACERGGLVRGTWNSRECFAIVVEKAEDHITTVFLPLGDDEFSVRDLQAPATRKLVIRYGTDWILQLRREVANLRDQSSSTSASVAVSATGPYLCVMDRNPRSLQDPVYVNLVAMTLEDPEGPVLEYREWDIWASADQVDKAGQHALYQYRS